MHQTLAVAHEPENATAPAADHEEEAPHRRLVLALVTAGLALRLFQYLPNRSLWMDEAVLASSILERSFGGLLQPLDYGQTAPLGFLFLSKLAVILFGTGEHALRLVPLLAGVAALLAVVPVARGYLSRNAVPVAVALFALAPFLIYYASEVKAYSVDALAAVLVLGAALAFARSEAPGAKETGALLAVGVVSVWLSQPAIFVLAGTGLVLGLHALRAGDGRRMGVLAGVGAAWLASFAGAYAVARHQLADPEYMQSFWRSGFLPLTPSSPAEWAWLPLRLLGLFREPLGAVGIDPSGMERPAAFAGFLAFAVGAAWMARRRRLELALLLAPLAMVLLASALRLYPFGGNWQSAGRVLIFLLPALVLVTAEGVERVRLRLGRRLGTVAALVLAGLMLAPSLAYAAVTVPQIRTEMKPVLGYADRNRQPGDLMYVYYYARPAFEYYAPRYGWSAENTLYGACARLNPVDYLRDLDRARGHGRVWFLFVNGTGPDGWDEPGMMLRYLEHVGERLDDRVSTGAQLFLYDLREQKRDPSPFPEPIPVFSEQAVEMSCRGPWGPKQPANPTAE